MTDIKALIARLRQRYGQDDRLCVTAGVIAGDIANRSYQRFGATDADVLALCDEVERQAAELAKCRQSAQDANLTEIAPGNLFGPAGTSLGD